MAYYDTTMRKINGNTLHTTILALPIYPKSHVFTKSTKHALTDFILVTSLDFN